MMRFMAEQEKLKAMLTQAAVPQETYDTIMAQNQELIARLVNDIEEQKEKEKQDVIESLRRRIEHLESLQSQGLQQPYGRDVYACFREPPPEPVPIPQQQQQPAPEEKR